MKPGSSTRHTLVLLAFLMLPAGLQAQQGLSADSLYKRGVTYYGKGNLEMARPLLERAFALYQPRQDSSLWLEAGIYLGQVLSMRDEYEQALRHFRSLMEREAWLHTDYSRASIHLNMAQIFKNTNQPDSAFQHLENALSRAVASGDSTMMGSVFNTLGTTSRTTGRYRKAIEYGNRALVFYAQRDDSSFVAHTLNNMGMAYRQLGLYDRAAEHLYRSLQLRLAYGADEDELGTIYNNLGSLQQTLGNYDQALVAFRKALDYHRRGSQPLSAGATLSNIGVLYSRMGNPQRALDYYRQSLEMVDNRATPGSTAQTYQNMAHELWKTDRREEATSLYEQALELRRQTRNPHLVASSYWDLAKVNIQQGNLQPAAIYIEEGAYLADTTGLARLRSEAAYWRGRLHFEREEFGQARTQFRNAWQISRELPIVESIHPLSWLSHAFDRLNSDSTLHYGRMAVELIERTRQQVGQASRMRQDYFRQHTGFYLTLAARSLDHGGSTAEAYRMVEASKARTLSDELREASLRIDEQLPEEERLERSRHLDRLQELYLQRETASGEAATDSLSGLVREAEFAWSAYQNELAQTYTQYRRLDAPEPVTLAEARALCPPNTAILEYAVADDRLIVFLVSRNETVARTVSLGRGEEGAGRLLTGLVQRFRDAILAESSPEELERLSSPLLELLVDPIARTLGTYEHLMVAPDGALAYLPFEALRRNGRYLIQDYTLKYIPSVTSLQLMESPPEENEMQLLAVAGSDFSRMGNGQDIIANSSVFRTLPSTLVEVDSIASRFPRSTVLKNSEVNEEAVKNSLEGSSYRYIHLATHGRIDEEQPAMSGLALGTAGDLEVADLNDGMLRSSEIYRLQLNTRMVVLSACNTGMGPLVSGEGILGMQRSFFYAGAPTVVVSLWNVGDRSTSYMMPLFYRHLAEMNEEEHSLWMRFGRWAGWERSIPYGSTAEAMRQTKLAMIDHPLLNHPVHWAPFISVGR
ncbi:MAG: CHAT domain-containing tetratricopeptide repeat protein [Balneolaceae bacterium]|nr:CHAT domain-containing tetratricopeptide repeat protein [Balneolaceae bacterium]